MTLTVCLVWSCGSEGSSPPGNAATALAAPAGPDYFGDVTRQAGVDFIHSIGNEHFNNLVKSSGGGGALLDDDRDGDLDRYVANGSFVEGFKQGKASDPDPSGATSGTQFWR